MEIKTIMQRLENSQKDDGGIKTASDRTTAPSTNQLQDQLRTALHAATAGAGSTKTASAAPSGDNSPTAALVKMAADLSNAEEEALVKQAQVYGAAMCDGFMARYGQYEGAAKEAGDDNYGGLGAVLGGPVGAAIGAQKGRGWHAAGGIEKLRDKVSSAPDVHDEEFAKFASANPDLVKEAFDLGYQRQTDELTKTAAASMEQGYNDTLNEIHKLAADNYKKGSAHAQYVYRQAQTA